MWSKAEGPSEPPLYLKALQGIAELAVFVDDVHYPLMAGREDMIERVHRDHCFLFDTFPKYRFSFSEKVGVV